MEKTYHNTITIVVRTVDKGELADHVQRWALGSCPPTFEVMSASLGVRLETAVVSAMKAANDLAYSATGVKNPTGNVHFEAKIEV